MWRAGGPNFCVLFSEAMGFRVVTDLEEYSISELIELIEKSAALLRLKLGTEPSQSKPESVCSFSVIEPGTSSAAATASEPTASPFAGERDPSLKSPFECTYHCKYCYARCCRPIDAHKNHACLEHRHRR